MEPSQKGFCISLILLWAFLFPGGCLDAAEPEIATVLPEQYLFEGAKIAFVIKNTNSRQFRWDFGDGAKRTGEHRYIHIYKSRGYYTVSASDMKGRLKGPLTKKVRIIRDGRELFIQNKPYFVGQTVNVDARGFVDRLVQWDFGDGTKRRGGKKETHTYKRPGTFTISANDFDGKGGKFFTVRVTIKNPVTHTDNRKVKIPGMIIAGEPATFKLEKASGGNFKWRFSDGQKGNGTTVHIKRFKQHGTIRLTIEDQSGKYKPLNKEFRVKPDNRELKRGEKYALPDDDLKFEVRNFLDNKVAWDFGDGTVKQNGSASETHKYKKPGRYKITARDFGGKSEVEFTREVSVVEQLPGFRVDMLELSFNDGKYYHVAPHKEPPPRYYVKIKATGRGILHGQWLMDNAVIGLFSVLMEGNRIVELRGNDVVRLPLGDVGPHQFTFKFSNYEFNRDIPILRYFVTRTGAIDIIAPAPGGKVPHSNTVRLKWEYKKALKDLHTYEIFISETPVRFLTDDKVTWKKTGNKIHFDLDTSKVKPGKWIYWQVRAVEPGGDPVTVSEISSFKLKKQ